MKSFIKLIGVALAAAVVLMLASCGEKGGTIEVTNNQTVPSLVNVYTGLIPGTDVKTIGAGETEKWIFEEDGTYTVTAVPPLGFTKSVTLLGGKTEKVSVK